MYIHGKHFLAFFFSLTTTLLPEIKRPNVKIIPRNRARYNIVQCGDNYNSHTQSQTKKLKKNQSRLIIRQQQTYTKVATETKTCGDGLGHSDLSTLSRQVHKKIYIIII